MSDTYTKILQQFREAIPLKIVDRIIQEPNQRGLLIKFNSNTKEPIIENVKRYIQSKYKLNVSTYKIENYSSIKNQYLTMPRTEMIILFHEEPKL